MNAQSRLMPQLFEDFNAPASHLDEPVVVEPQPDPAVAEEALRAEAWREGYLAGHKAGSLHPPHGNNDATMKLITALAAVDCKVGEAARESAELMGTLLGAMMDTILPGCWTSTLADRVRAVTDRLTPAFLLDAKVEIHGDAPCELPLDGVAAFCEALEPSSTVTGVTIRWQRGHAALSQAQLRDDLQAVIAPLLAAGAG